MFNVMVQNILLKILLFPISLLYGLGVEIRNLLYRMGALKGVSFNIPVISVGNLTVGGAGKSPHIEYLVRQFQAYLDVATLSRGYQRKTRGFLLAHEDNDANLIGDEALQFKRKFPDITVAVGENRIIAVSKLLIQKPGLQLILLDDAFQHRAIKPGLNILLTEYDRPFTRDMLLPSGRLREWKAGYKRADIIVVTKCPDELSTENREKLINEIAPLSYQRIYFSKYKYLLPYYLFDKSYHLNNISDKHVLLICAIARTDYLLKYVNEAFNEVRILEYEDHHYFDQHDLSNLVRHFEHLQGPNKIILTTEKDAMRLELHRSFIMEHNLPIYILPVEVEFMDAESNNFDEDVKQFLLDFKV